MLFRFKVEGITPDVLLRLPCPDLSRMAGEKSKREGVMLRFIQQETQIPVAQQLSYGRESLIGPFAILQWVENKSSMSEVLRNPNDDLKESHKLNPDISESLLEDSYAKMARCLVQLAEPSFPSIGSLVEVEKGSFSVGERPITRNMNDMMERANVPSEVFDDNNKIYETADEYYLALAKMHLAQLAFQHNDAITSKDDCRNKYVVRQLIYKLAKEGRLSIFGFAEDDWSAQSKLQVCQSDLLPAPSGADSFRLFGDDLRPGNILVDSANDIAAVIDWEFAYVGPTQFVLDPPWWLLLRIPETWPLGAGITDWSETYDKRLKNWLAALKRVEETSNSLPFVLSAYMEQSWATGRFWLNYAMRSSWCLDAIYWNFLDERFFGEREKNVAVDDLWKTRVGLLGEEVRNAMEAFVDIKMEETGKRMLIDEWDQKDLNERLSKIMFD